MVMIKKYWRLGGLAIGLLILIIAAVKIFSGGPDLPAVLASKGDFVIKLTENGELKAVRAVSVSAPQVSGRLLITYLMPEGSYVKKGEMLLQFDPSEPQHALQENKSNLKIAQSALDRALADLEVQKRTLELDLKKAENAFAEKRSIAPAKLEEAKAELELAKSKHSNQLKMLEADISKYTVEVEKAKEKVARAEQDLQLMSVKAPIAGLVVYLDIWKGGQMGKPQEGDSPWPGQELITLPDLSSMMVKTAVSEVDVDKVKPGQAAEVRLDAYPGPVFAGKVTKIGTLAHSKNYQSDINVFDVEVTLDKVDPKIKPGMSAKAEIITEKIPNSVWVPIEAVFEKNGKTVVYVTGSGSKTVEVKTGKRSDTDVIITSGLKGGEKISLLDPTQKKEEQMAPAKKEAPGVGL